MGAKRLELFSSTSRQGILTFGAILLALLSSLAIADRAQAETAAIPCRYVKLKTLPITFAGLRPTVEGSINGKTTTMLLDTGSYNTVLTRDAAEKLGLSIGHSNISGFGISGESIQYRARVDEISIGAVHGGKTSFSVVWESETRLPYGALIGADFLFQHDLEIFLAEKQIGFFHPLNCDEAFLAYWDRNASVVALDAISSTDRRQIIMVEVNGQRIRATIDSGATRSVIGLAAAARAGITPQSPGVAEIENLGGIGTHHTASWIAPFESFAIGNETVKNVKIIMMDMWRAAQSDLNNPKTADWVQEQPEMLLGADFLRAHRVLFALSQRRLYFSFLGGNVFRVDAEPVSSGDNRQR